MGAQGLGGLTTVLDVKISIGQLMRRRSLWRSLPNCAATRHAHFTLGRSPGRRSSQHPICPPGPMVSWDLTNMRGASILTA
ncbi:hypothetical protein F2981_21630 (plasmid) [Sinorhizobium meliloti]|nr:hypothetical protein [Sinorhizobium meliloti]